MKHATGIFLGMLGRGVKLKDYKYKGGHVDALTDELGKSRVIINTSDYNRKPSNCHHFTKVTILQDTIQ